MYTIKMQNTVIHDERTVFVDEPVLKRGLNKSGTLTFTISDENPGYTKIVERHSQVYVYKNGTKESDLLWSGTVLAIEQNIYGIKNVTCEGTLSALNDVGNNVYIMGRNSISCSLGSYLDTYMKDGHNYSLTEKGKSIAISFGKQDDFAGKIYVYLLRPDEPVMLHCVIGFTCQQLSNMVLYAPVERTGDANVLTSIGFGWEAPKNVTGNIEININNVYMSAHTPHMVYTIDKVLFLPDSFPYPSDALLYEEKRIKISAGNGVAQGYSGGAKSLIKVNVKAPTIRNMRMLSASFKDEYCSTLEKMEKVINKFGGYMEAYATNGKGITLTYYEGFTQSCGQKIFLADNLEDYIEVTNFEGVYNKITPLGKNTGTSFLWDYVDITSVNDECPYVTNDASASLVGPIEKIVHYNDVEDPEELLSLASMELQAASEFEFSVSVKAADKSLIDVDIDAFEIGYLTEIIIPPLGVDKELVCTEITNYLSEPEKDEYAFGAVPKTSSSYVSGASGTSSVSSGSGLDKQVEELESALGGFMIQCGRVSIKPVANKPTMAHVDFPKPFQDQPYVIVTPVTSVPGTNVLGVGATNNTKNGFDAYITRTNTTETTLAWIAIGKM